jgi:hypothetical protein
MKPNTYIKHLMSKLRSVMKVAVTFIVFTGFVCVITINYLPTEVITELTADYPFNMSENENKEHKNESDDKDEFDLYHSHFLLLTGLSACNSDEDEFGSSVFIPKHTPPPEQVS